MAIKDKNRRDAIKLFAFFKKLMGFEFENLFFFYDPRYFIFIFILGFIKILIIFFIYFLITQIFQFKKFKGHILILPFIAISASPFPFNHTLVVIQLIIQPPFL